MVFFFSFIAFSNFSEHYLLQDINFFRGHQDLGHIFAAVRETLQLNSVKNNHLLIQERFV